MREDRFLYKKGSYAYIMKQKSSVNIDTEYDFELATFILEGRGGLPNLYSYLPLQFEYSHFGKGVRVA